MKFLNDVILTGAGADLTAPATVTFSGLSATTETSAVVVNSSGVLSKRTLGSNAFNSTTIPTNNNQLTNGNSYLTDSSTQTKYLRSDADDTFSGGLVSSARDEGIFGTYDSYKTDHIWSMGTSYKNHASGTNFGNLYGLAYKHTNNTTGGTMANGHQAVWCQNGTGTAAIGNNIWTSGTVIASALDINGNADISGNLTGVDAFTASGKIQGAELEGTSLDINGNGDVSGTLNVNGSLTTTGAGVSGNLYANRYFQNATGIPTNNLGAPTVTEMALFENQFKPQTTLANGYDDLADLTFFTRATGTSESDYAEVTSYSDDIKRKFLRTHNSSVVIPNTHNSFRVEFVARHYTFANAMVAYWSSNSHTTQVHVWKRRCDNNTWYQHTTSSTTVSSWPGHLYLPFSTIAWNETNTTSSSHYNKIRIEFTPNWSGHATYGTTAINLSGMQIWGGYPSGRRTVHSYDQNGKLSLFGALHVPGETTMGGNLVVTGSIAGDLYGTVNASTTAHTQNAGNNSTKVATTAYADAAVAALVDSAPANLNTLNELAEALNDDDDAIVTINNTLATKVSLTGNETIAGVKQFSNYINAAGNIQMSGYLYNGDVNTSIDLKDHSDHTWFRNQTGYWTFQTGTGGDDWTQTFALHLPAAGSTANAVFAQLGQNNSNQAEGRYKGVQIVKRAGSAIVDGDLQAGTTNITGALTIIAPTANLHAATKAYVDGAVIANTDTQDLTISTRTISLTNGGSVTVPAPTYASVTGKPTTFAPSSHTHTFASLTSRPTSIDGYGITDAFNGAYGSLSGTPTIPSGNQIIDWTSDQGSTNIHTGNYINTTYNKASSTVLGLVKVGSGLAISGAGVLSVSQAAEADEESGGAMSSEDKTKLNAIEAEADVTDATNVAAAGASMKSATETISGAKTFSSTIAGSINGNSATTSERTITGGEISAISTNTSKVGITTGTQTIAGAKTFSTQIIGQTINLGSSSGYINRTAAQFATDGTDKVYVGSNNYGWNDARDYATNLVDVDAPVLDQNDQHCGIICPVNVSQVSIMSQVRMNAANGTMQVKVYKMARATAVNTTNLALTLIASATVSTVNGRMTTLDATGSTAVSAGDLIIVGFGKTDGGAGQKPRLNFTLTGTTS